MSHVYKRLGRTDGSGQDLLLDDAPPVLDALLRGDDGPRRGPNPARKVPAETPELLQYVRELHAGETQNGQRVGKFLSQRAEEELRFAEGPCGGLKFPRAIENR